eukprot:TRINITY_DN1758_c0_g1_i1.p1 TRINITY_DN1758_c0_g1~~TRINITY_DN1758_c0_g1_i1.p1  ORF type:complete len:355 (-),score=35.34 TRINITY_DN1758_c0_g1_i1:124-1188(-)
MKLRAKSSLLAVVTCLFQSVSPLKIGEHSYEDDGEGIKDTCGLPKPREVYSRMEMEALPKDVDLAKMASVAHHVRYSTQSIAGYKKVAFWQIKKVEAVKAGMSTGIDCNETYVAAIYSHKAEKKCVLALAGGSKLSTSFGKVKLTPKHLQEYCQLGQVQSGLAQAANMFLKGHHNKLFKRLLSDNNECRTVAIAAHGYAGAVASLIAACANEISDFRVDYLYTFGAPPPSKHQIMNKQSLSAGSTQGCFKGVRVYNDDPFTGDDLPALWSREGYQHPKLGSVQIMENQWDISSRFHFCDTKSSKLEPIKHKLLNVTARAPTTYVTRLLRYTRHVWKDPGAKFLITASAMAPISK